jgi:hypothetical protein
MVQRIFKEKRLKKELNNELWDKSNSSLQKLYGLHFMI